MDTCQVVNQEKSLSLLSTTGRFGVKGVKYFALVALLFGVINIILLIIGIFRFWGADKLTSSFIGVILILGIGILFTVIAFYFTYTYLIMDGLKLVYSFAFPFFKRLCDIIVNKSGDFFTNKVNIKDVHIDKAFNVGNIVSEVYGQKVPRMLQKGINYLMKRIPFAAILVNVKNGIRDRNEEQISVVFYQQVDSYITHSILGGNSMKWMLWLFPLNIVIQLLIIYFLVG